MDESLPTDEPLLVSSESLPEPVPVQGVPRSRLTAGLMIGAVLAAILLCCTCSIASIFIARSAFDNVLDTFTSGTETVQWSGDGRFAVIQSFTAEEEPLVAVWDSMTGESRSESGYYVVAVEHYGAVAWLVPAGDRAAPTGGWLFPRGDVAPEELLVWNLREEAPRVVTAEGEPWNAWRGPGAWTAQAKVDPERGAFPSSIVFGSHVYPVEPHAAELPEDFGTFDIVGWSQSGRYLAIVERVTGEIAPDVGSPSAPVVADESDPEPDPSAYTIGPAARILIIDAEDGQVVTSTHSNLTYMPGPGVAAWYPGDDILLVTALDETRLAEDVWEGSTRLRAYLPDGTSDEAHEVLGYESPDSWEHAWDLVILGAGENGVMLLADQEEIWMLDVDGMRQAGHLPIGYSAAWHPRGGILLLTDEWSDRAGTMHSAIARFDERGGSRETIWEGPERGAGFGTWD